MGGQGRSLFLRDLDREADRLMHRLVDILRRGTKTPRDGWNAIMRAHGSGGGVALCTWRKICESLGFQDREALKLFHCLQASEDRESGRIKREQWKFLSLWEKGPPQYDSMMRRAHKDIGREREQQKRDWGEKSNNSDESAVSVVQGRRAGRPSEWHSPPKGAEGKKETVSFQVELTEEEYQEYLKRLR